MLDFERAWWNNDEPRDQVIRARFQCSPEEYHAELTTVLDDPAAMEHDPMPGVVIDAPADAIAGGIQACASP